MNFNDFFNELKRRNVFKGTISYLIFSWVLLQVISIISPIVDAPIWVGKLVLILLIVLLPVWIFISWYFEVTPEGIKKTKIIPVEKSITKKTGKKFNTFIIVFLALAITLLFVDRFRIKSQGQKVNKELAFYNPDEKSIAVLPFNDMSPNKQQGYFADGLAEELLNSLSKVEELKVTSRTSAFSFKGKGLSLPEIAAKLHVNFILEGSVRTYDSLIRISVKLVETNGDNNIWSQQWDKELKNIFKIQNEISEAVAKNLQLRILDNIIPQVKETTADAYAKFLEARYDYSNKLTDTEFKNVEKKLNESIAIDSTYAPAWLLLGRVYHSQNNYGVLSVEEGYKKVQYAAHKAKQIDSTNAEVYTLLSLIALDYEKDFKKAGFLANKALELEPNNLNAISSAAEVAFFQNKVEDAIALYNKAIRQDPLNDNNYYHAANMYYAAKQYDQALILIDKAIQLSPGEELSYAIKAVILMRMDRLQEALQVIEKEPLEGFRLHVKAMIYHHMGNKTKAEETLNTLIQKHEESYSYQIAMNYADLKDRDKMYNWLDKAYNYKDFGLIELHSEPVFNPYRKEKRFKEIVKKIGYKY